MSREYRDDIRKFVRENAFTVIMTVIVFVLLYYKLAFTTNVCIDTEQYIMGSYGRAWVVNNLGRFGMYTTTMIVTAFHWSPYANGFAFMVFYVLAVLVWLYLFHRIDDDMFRPFYPVFSILFISYPIWVYQFYFTLQSAAIALAVLLEALALLLLHESMADHGAYVRSFMIIMSVLFTIYAFGTYQSFPGFHISACLGLSLLYYDKIMLTGGGEKNSRIRRFLRLSLYYAFHFIVSLAGYLMIVCILQRGIESNGYLDICWGKRSILDNIHAIIYDIKNMFTGRDEYAGYVMIICSILFAFILLYAFKHVTISEWIIYLILIIGNIFSGLSMSMIQGDVASPRTKFALCFSAAFCAMYSMGVMARLCHGRYSVIIGVPLSAVLLLCMLLQINRFCRLVYTIDICNEQQYNVGADIVRDIQASGASPDAVVAVVGGWRAPLNYACYPSDIIGTSSFYWDYSEDDITSGTRRSGLYIGATFGSEYFFWLDDEQKEVVNRCAPDMPVYPETGYVRNEDGLIIVKLSEPQ